MDNFLRSLRLHKVMIWALTLSSTIFATGITYLIPEKYSATALVLIRPQDSIGMKNSKTSGKEVLDLPATGSSMQIETPSKTYMEVIKSRTVSEKVVRMLKLDEVQQQSSLWYRVKTWGLEFGNDLWSILQFGRVIWADPFEKAVVRLIDNISLTAIKGTFVFEITYLGRTPAEASSVANTAAAMFVEYNSAANETEAKNYRSFVETKLEQTEQELLAARERLQTFKESNQTTSFKEEQTEAIKAISSLQASLDRTDVELTGALTQYTQSNPKVVKLQTERQKLISSINAHRAHLEHLPENEKQLATLELSVKTLEDNYSVLEKEFEEAKLRETKRASEIRVVSPASTPINPQKPIKYYYALSGLALSLLLGVSLAQWLEFFKERLYTVREVEQVFGVPVIATIPKS